MAWPKVPSAETRAKLSAAGKGRKHSDAAKAAISAALKGRPKSPEHRAKQSQTCLAHGPTEKQTAAVIASNKNRVISDETRAKLAAASTGRPKSPETIAKLKAAHVGRPGRPASPEHKAKVSAALKGRPKHPGHGAKVSAALKGRAPSQAAKDALKLTARNIQPSLPERLMAARLDADGVEYIAQYRLRWWTVDFYVPATNTVIEVNGCYWHGCEPCGHSHQNIKSQHRDKRKATYLANHGYTLVTVWEHELIGARA